MFKMTTVASAVALAVAALPAFAQDAPPSAPAPASPAAPPQRVEITGTVQRLDAARNSLSPETGSSIYRFSQQDIANLPLGESTPLNQVLLQAPGVVADSFGQLHVRGDHANMQYRIDGVVIPEAISGFGQALDTRFASQINLLTGALPAQYGYRTAGIVDIRTKQSLQGTSGSVTATVGTRGYAETSAQLLGGKDDWSYFLTGSFLRNNEGIENPTSSSNALHDRTNQTNGFASLSKVLDANSRLSLMLGASSNRFQIPNTPGLTPSFTLDGAPPIDSASLDANQTESNQFQVLTYQATPNDRLSYQVALFHRYTDVHYQPDPVGDLAFNGVAAQILRKNDAYGVQTDASYDLNPQHTLRAGLFMQHERFSTDNTSSVFRADSDGNQTSGTPITIVDNTRIIGQLYGLYLQDEWRVTPKLTVNYGARYDHVNTVVNEQQFSPRLGVVYEVNPRTRLHAGYARYFTPPPTEKIDTTSVTRFLNTTNALPSDANTAVSSERSNYFDAGVSRQLTSDLTVGVDAYYRQVKNLQDEGQFGNALIYSAFNYAEGRVGGIELSASYRHANLSAYGNLTVSKAQGRNIVSGQFNFAADELAYIANHWVHLDHDQTLSASAGVAYQWGLNKLTADLLFGSGLRNGFANSEHLPSYTQVNAGIARPFDAGMLGKVETRLTIINLFDRVYQLRDGSGIGVGAPQVAPRRGVFVAMTKSF
ncbi:MAG: outer rane transport family protein [Ramlibacter sp.]|nr:outer rane transport family protein [Ramlibacter sp.]